MEAVARFCHLQHEFQLGAALSYYHLHCQFLQRTLFHQTVEFTYLKEMQHRFSPLGKLECLFSTNEETNELQNRSFYTCFRGRLLEMVSGKLHIMQYFLRPRKSWTKHLPVWISTFDKRDLNLKKS